MLEREINRALPRFFLLRLFLSFFFLFSSEGAPAKEYHRKTEERALPVAVSLPFPPPARRDFGARGLFKLGTNAPGIYGLLADLRPYLLDDAVGPANVVFDDPPRDPSSHKSTLISFATVNARARARSSLFFLRIVFFLANVRLLLSFSITDDRHNNSRHAAD